MSQFRDSEGREWSLRLTVGNLAELRRDAGVDLMPWLKDPTTIGDLLFGDPERLGRILWVLVRDQAQSVSPESFFGGLDGTALEAAVESLLESVVDFFPRAALATAIRGKVKETLRQMDQQILAEVSKSNAGGSPVSSGSTRPG